ncbi:MAG: hypothetical protein V3V33_15145 [Candidatus Lokiarchaeia archaeon]
MSEIIDKLIKLLDALLIKLKVSSSSLITEDGLVIATNSQQNEEEIDVRTNFAAISASILSMAERGIEIINANKILNQIKIDAGLSQDIDENFTVLITRAYSNILLQIIFPKRLNIGLIHFEVNNTIKEINKLTQQINTEELLESIGSLL